MRMLKIAPKENADRSRSENQAGMFICVIYVAPFLRYLNPEC